MKKKILVVESCGAQRFRQAARYVLSTWPSSSVSALLEHGSTTAELAAFYGWPVVFFRRQDDHRRTLVLSNEASTLLREGSYDRYVMSLPDCHGVRYWQFRMIPIRFGISRIIRLDGKGNAVHFSWLAWIGDTVWSSVVLRMLRYHEWIPRQVQLRLVRLGDYFMIGLLTILAIVGAGLKRIGLHPGCRPPRQDPKTRPKMVVCIPYLCVGGAQRVLVTFLKRVPPHTCSVEVWALRNPDNSFEGDIRSLDVPLKFLPCHGDVPYWKIIWCLVRYLKEASPDVVIGWLPWATVFATFAGCIVGIPRVAMFFHSQSPDKQGGTYPVWQRPLDILAGQVAHVVFVNSTVVARDYRAWAWIPHWKIVPVNLGVDERFLTPLARETRENLRHALGFRDCQVIGLVGRLDPKKDHDTFLQAVADLSARMPCLKAMLIGNGNEEKRIKGEVQRLGLENIVQMLGARTDIPDLIGSLDVLVLTSRSEGFAIVLLEAQAMQVPVVTTAAGGTVEAVEDGVTGFLVPQGEALQVANRIEHLLRDEHLRRDMGVAGRARVLEQFDGGRMTGSILEACGIPQTPCMRKSQDSGK